MSKRVIVIILVILTASVLGIYFYSVNISPNNTTPIQSILPSIAPKKVNPLTVNLPVGIKNKSVNTARVLYGFQATIIDIKKDTTDPTKQEIITTLSANEVPKFVVGPKLPVSFINGGEITKKGNISDLKVGQTVIINISYGLKLKKWNPVSSIYIPQQSATPSSTITKKP